jgi:ubiquinone/menaquinone biosynthesis C-methylase UbiE
MNEPIHTDDEAFEDVSTREGYDRWSEIYDDEDNPLIALEEPLVTRLLGDVHRLRVLDLGCGTGRHSVPMSTNGADVVAIDFSTKMIGRAYSKTTSQPIRFVIADIGATLPFSDHAFDRLTCCLVLDHIHNLDSLFSEMARMVKPTGFVLLSIMHPAMTLRGVQARFQLPDSNQRIRVESATHNICDYVRATVQAGFHIDHISEHAVTTEMADKSERARRYVGWPMLLLIRLTVHPKP